MVSDSKALAISAATGRSLKQLGGRLVLLQPQATLLGVDQLVITVQTSKWAANRSATHGG